MNILEVSAQEVNQEKTAQVKISDEWTSGIVFKAVTGTGRPVDFFASNSDAEVLKILLAEYGDIRIEVDEIFKAKTKGGEKLSFIYRRVNQIVPASA
jgi:hypothetical protein